MEAPDNAANITEIFKNFKFLMSKGSVNDALKLLIRSISNGTLPLSDKT